MAYLALDLGAGSGRAIIGEIKNEKIHLEEILRFENNPVQLHNTIYWNFLSLFENIKKSISLAKRKVFQLNGIGVDTWGVDFGLLDKNGNLLSNPIVYRDRRTEGMTAKVLNFISKEELYTVSGIQQMEINTLFQLFSLLKNNNSPQMRSV
jgi:Sugar (pentulose and hexulose) kinases